MKQLEAMNATIKDVVTKGFPPGLDGAGPCSMAHFTDMYNRALVGNFSEGKTGRWLGWIQGVLCGRGVLTLDECKEINKRFAEE